MAGFPQITEEDSKSFTETLNELVLQSEATSALIVEKAGYLIHQCGRCADFDTTQVATLASNAFNATQFLASLITETNFTGMYQQGERFSTLILNVDENCLVVVIFKATLSVGMIKYYASIAIKCIADQLLIAQGRDNSGGIDLADLDPTNVSELFKRRETGESASTTP